MFDEKSKYLECFLSRNHFIQAKPRASRMTMVKIPPRKARAAEELDDVTGQLAVLVELSVLAAFGLAPSSVWVEFVLGWAFSSGLAEFALGLVLDLLPSLVWLELAMGPVLGFTLGPPLGLTPSSNWVEFSSELVLGLVPSSVLVELVLVGAFSSGLAEFALEPLLELVMVPSSVWVKLVMGPILGLAPSWVWVE